MLKKLNKKNNKGFTLVELLVVIAIIGILAVVAVPSLMKNMDKAKGAKIVADFSAIKSAIMAEYAEGAVLVDGDLDSDNTSINVENLSNEADYTLDVHYATENDEDTPVTGIDLIITAKNEKTLPYVVKSVGLSESDIDENVLVVPVIK